MLSSLAGNIQWYWSRRAVSRFFKYAYLLVALSVALIVVFSCFSYYYARRSLDDELSSKRISSLEYLTVLTKQRRALVLASVETRCAERNELAVLRADEADGREKLHDAYKASIDVKNAILDYLNSKVPAELRSKIDINALKGEVNKPTFTLTHLDDAIIPVAGVDSHSDEFHDATRALLTSLQQAFSYEQAKLARYATEFSSLRKTFGINAPALKNVELLEQRMARLNQEKRRVEAKLGVDIDDLLARYAVWTSAISGSDGDDPVLDEMAIRLDADNDAAKLTDAPCKALQDYYTKVNGHSVQGASSMGPVARGFERYGSILRLYYFLIPSIAQTLCVTLLLGAVGALTINVLRLSSIGWWAKQPEPLWGELVLSPLLGALAAFVIFLLGSTGLLLTGDVKSGPGGAVALSAFFIGLVGFVSGLLYDEAFGRVRRYGAQLFGTDEQIGEASPADKSISDALRTAGFPLSAELALRTRLGSVVAPMSEFTIVLPADEFLASLTVAAWNELVAPTSPATQASWQQHHVSGKRILSTDVVGSRPDASVTELVMLDGAKLPIATAIDGLKIGELPAVKADIIFQGGAIHLTKGSI